MSQWGAPPRSPTTETYTPTSDPKPDSPSAHTRNTSKNITVDTSTSSYAAQPRDDLAKASPSPTTQQRFRSDSRTERNSRPLSMMQAYQPPTMDMAQDTLPELQPIFTFLNSHSNKLYQEGYFLKLHDLDSRAYCCQRSMTCSDTDCRRSAKYRSSLERVLCAAGWYCAFALGCIRPGCCWRGW